MSHVPFCVSAHSGKNLLMDVTFSPGHDAKNPALIAASSVSFVRKPKAAWRYDIASALLDRLLVSFLPCSTVLFVC